MPRHPLLVAVAALTAVLCLMWLLAITLCGVLLRLNHLLALTLLTASGLFLFVRLTDKGNEACS